MNINNFFYKNKIDKSKLYLILHKLNHIKNNYSDLYIQIHNSNNIIFENGNIKNICSNFFKGMSLRSIKNNNIIILSINDINYNYFFKNLFIINEKLNIKSNNKYVIKNNLNYNKIYNKLKINNFKKNIKIINHIYDKLKKYIKEELIQVNISLKSCNEEICILNNINNLNIDNRLLTELKIFITLKKNKKYSHGFSSIGIRSDISKLYDRIDNKCFTYIEKCIEDCFNMSINNLYSVDSPSGRMPIVLGPGCPGVLLHEAVGHGLESDFIVNNSSIFYNKLNKKVASKYCTVIDNGTIKNSNGYINIDDEGNKSKCNILIKNGILKNFICDNFNANLLGIKSTGNGRRESYKDNIIPRMTNTYLLPGKYNPDDIINSVEEGIYAKSFTDGQVDITSGKFTFSTSLAFIIKNGKISKPLKKLTLIGSIFNIMNKISMVANDFEIDTSSSICIKENQCIPVSVGQPTIKIEEITVGGTK